MNAYGRTLGMVAAGVLLVWTAWTVAAPIEVGDPVQKVREVLGEPQGYMKMGSYETFLYYRGRVEARDGVVTTAELVSPEEGEQRRVAEERRREEQERARIELQQRRRAEGESLMAARLGDPAFAALPTYERLAFWQTFRHQYPEVNAEAAYTAAFMQYQRELENQRTQERLAALEARTAEAEARARRAEREAEDAKYRWGFGTTYVVPYSYVTYGARPYQTCPTPYTVYPSYPFGTISYSGSRIRAQVTIPGPSTHISVGHGRSSVGFHRW